MKRFFYVCFQVLITSCGLFGGEPKPSLPPITTEGKNTFGCLVNGEIFLPKGHFAGDGLTAQSQERTWLWIGADKDGQGMTLNLKDDRGIGEKTYLLGESLKGSAEYNKWSKEASCYYDADELIDGHVKIIKFSREKRIVSGTFEFRIYDKDCGDTVTVTNGRFDIGGLIL